MQTTNKPPIIALGEIHGRNYAPDTFKTIFSHLRERGLNPVVFIETVLAHKHYDVTASKNKWDKALLGFASAPYSNEDLMEERRRLFKEFKILSPNRYETKEGKTHTIRATQLNRKQTSEAIAAIVANYEANGDKVISAGFIEIGVLPNDVIQIPQDLFCNIDNDEWHKQLKEWKPNTPVPIKNLTARDDEAAKLIDGVLSTNPSFDVAIVICGNSHFVDDRSGRKTIKQNLENAGYNVSHIFADNSKEDHTLIHEQKALTVKNGGLFADFAEPNTVQENIESFLDKNLLLPKANMNISNLMIDDKQSQQTSNHQSIVRDAKPKQQKQKSSIQCCFGHE